MASWNKNPAYSQIALELECLISAYPPPFIFINDPTTSRITARVVKSVVSSLDSVHWAHVDAIACFNARILFDSIMNALADWIPGWRDGCTNWGAATSGHNWNENVDAFIHGLQALADKSSPNSSKGKGKETTSTRPFIIVIERAERLRETLPELIPPLTRLADLSRLNLSVVFISTAPWEDIRPPLGASPDPYHLHVSPSIRDETIASLSANFQATFTTSSSSSKLAATPYHPALLPLYTQFLHTLYDIVWTFIKDPHELAYIAAARWPGFVKPYLDDYKLLLQQVQDQREEEINSAMQQDDVTITTDTATLELELTTPSEDIRMRLVRLFKPTFIAAMESLYPRLTDATDWARRNEPEDDIFLKPLGYTLPSTSIGATLDGDGSGMSSLPRMSKFILVAAFIASTNPARSDIRMFGRGVDEKKRKRKARKTGGGARSKSGVSKVPQRLLGPTPFPLDRLLAMLGGMLEEYDADDRPTDSPLHIPGEYTDMEISRVAVYSAISELVSIRLLHRTSPSDRIDGPPMYKCGVSYEVARELAKELEVPLNDLLWDPL